MRAQPFLQFLRANYVNWPTAAALSNNSNIRGGWEGWLQVEIARTFVNLGGGRICEREVQYPSGHDAPNQYIRSNLGVYQAGPAPGIRCDFYLHHPEGGQQDDTYLELKCIIPIAFHPAAVDDAWFRFRGDITKIRNISDVNNSINGIAVLASFGQFNAPLPHFPFGVNAYVWDPGNNVVRTMNNVIQGGPDRFFIIAASVVG